jgi:DNA-binding Lrp family transcriptional regulator
MLLRKIKELDQLNVVLGTYDVILHLTVRSMSRLGEISNQINYFPGLEKAYYSVEKVMKK